jgi:hypothetical protein
VAFRTEGEAVLMPSAAYVLAAGAAIGVGMVLGQWLVLMIHGMVKAGLHYMQRRRNGDHSLSMCEACGAACSECGPLAEKKEEGV